MFGLNKLQKIKLKLIKNKLLKGYSKNFVENSQIFLRAAKKRKLNYFYIKLVQHCNLNCRGCDEFSPLAEKEFIDISILEKDLNRIRYLTNGNVDNIALSGGEPLLFPEEKIIYIIKLIKQLFPACKILFFTNGILLNEISSELWRVFKEYKIVILLTVYPINVNYDEILKKIKENNIEYHNQNGNNELKTSWHLPFNLNGKTNSQELVFNFLNCVQANNCIYLNDGKLYTCSTIGNIHHFNTFFNKNLKVSKNDYIDIYKAKNLNEILEYLSNPIPFCKYCDVKNRKYDLKWDYSKRSIAEWT